MDWDEPLHETDNATWQTIREELKGLADIRVPLLLCYGEPAILSEIYRFADESERAYAGVIYVQTTNHAGENRAVLVIAKTKVAPLKQVSLQRLLLYAAVLTAKLAIHLRAILGDPSTSIHLWSDSPP